MAVATVATSDTAKELARVVAHRDRLARLLRDARCFIHESDISRGLIRAIDEALDENRENFDLSASPGVAP